MTVRPRSFISLRQSVPRFDAQTSSIFAFGSTSAAPIANALISETAPKIGRSTEEAMRFGAIVGYRGMVREIAETLESGFAEKFRLVATGGFARWALRYLDLDFVIDPTLTLYGAGVICARRI